MLSSLTELLYDPQFAQQSDAVMRVTMTSTACGTVMTPTALGRLTVLGTTMMPPETTMILPETMMTPSEMTMRESFAKNFALAR